MANVKITDLAAYTNPASTDVLAIVDVGADVTKKISIADLLENAGSGTADAPGIAFDGDSNTGIYRPGDDQLAISTNGAQRLFVDASGNVGVGYASPSNFVGGDLGATAPLVVGDGTGTRNVNIFSANNGYGHLAFSDGTSGSSTYAGLIQYYHTNDSMAFYTGSSLKMFIDSSGNVGIGSTAPQSLLNISTGATAGAQDVLILGTSASGINGSHALWLGAYESSQFGCKIKAEYAYASSTNTSLLFETHGTGGLQERARIDSSGRLLVGTSSDSGSGALLQAPSFELFASTTTRALHQGLQAHYNNESVSDDHVAIDLATGGFTFFTAIVDVAVASGDTLESAASIMVDARFTTVQSTILGGFNTANFDVVNGKTGTDAKFNICLDGSNGSSYLAFRNRMGGTRRVNIQYRILRTD